MHLIPSHHFNIYPLTVLPYLLRPGTMSYCIICIIGASRLNLGPLTVY